MSNRQPWLRDRSLIGVPVGWRRVGWVVRHLAGEHGLRVSLSVAWPRPESTGYPLLCIDGDTLTTASLSPLRQENQRKGLWLAHRHAMRATRICMACGGEEFPSSVRLRSGDHHDVVATICLDCEVVSAQEGGAYWPTISRFDPLADEDAQGLQRGWDAETQNGADDPDEDGQPDIWDTWPDA